MRNLIHFVIGVELGFWAFIAPKWGLGKVDFRNKQSNRYEDILFIAGGDGQGGCVHPGDCADWRHWFLVGVKFDGIWGLSVVFECVYERAVSPTGLAVAFLWLLGVLLCAGLCELDDGTVYQSDGIEADLCG